MKVTVLRLVSESMFQDEFVHLGPIPIMQCFFRNSIVLARTYYINGKVKEAIETEKKAVKLR